MNNKLTIKAKLFLSVFVIFSFIYCLSLALKSGITSDAASMYLEAFDMANGNWLLQGWTLSTVPFYFTETLWYAVIIKIIGYHQGAMWWVPVLVYTLVILIASLIIVDKNNKVVGVLALLMCVSMPSPLSSGLTLAMCIHVGCILATLLCLYLTNTKTRFYLVAVFFISSLAMYSDPMFLYTFVAPYLAAIVIAAYYSKRLKNISLTLVIILSVVAAKTISYVTVSYEILVTPGTIPPKFVDYNSIFHNLDLFLQGVINYFDAFIFGKEIGVESSFYAARFVIMLAWFTLLVASIKRLFGKSLLDNYLIIATALLPIAYIASNMAVDLATTRYLVFSFITGSILIGRFINIASVKTTYICTAFAVVFICNFSAVTFGKPNDLSMQIADYIQSNDLGDGYGTFWVASSVTVRGGNDVRPVTYDGEKGEAFHWLSKNSWYGFRSRYVVLSNSNDIAKVERQFGGGYQVVNIGNAHLVIYQDNRVIF
ncbi:hypothetical protein [Escherichia coli]|uniref:hypothetical protein n=1 Tax=Escherichia coli TaxID=562 RepID=UPI003FD2B5A1